MPTGSFYCGAIRIEYSGIPITTALCHCSACKHYTGSTYSINYLISPENFHVVNGIPKEITKTADSGKSITNCFCGDCGTTMFRYGDVFGGKDGAKVLQSGILDENELINQTKVEDELFVGQRVEFLKALEYATQNEGMPSAPPKKPESGEKDL